MIRQATAADIDALAHMQATLWPDGSVDEHAEHIRSVVAGAPPSTLPLTIFVAEVDGARVGFVEVGLRSHAEDCDPTRPVGFIEGWFVEASYRKHGVGRALIDAAEAWCVAQGCVEVASNTWLDNEDSQRAHQALGYELVERTVHFRKALSR